MARYRDKNGKTRMERLNEGIHQFLEEIKNDDILADSVEIAVVTFNTVAGTALAFSTIENIEGMTITAGNTAGDTPKGVEKALELLENEKKFLKDNGKRYNQPWIVIMSDGRATASYNKETGTKDQDDVDRRLIVAQNKTKYLESQDKLTVIPVLISEISDGEYYQDGKRQMQGFTNSNRCKEIGDAASQVSFRDFFKVLSRSVSVSNADLLFADAHVASGERHSDSRPVGRGDYISQDEVVRMIRRTPSSTERIVKTTIPVIEPIETKTKELDEVERLRREAIQTSSVEDDPPEDEYEREMEDVSVTSVATDTTTPISTVTKSKTTDDSFLESLLAGLDDWDDI